MRAPNIYMKPLPQSVANLDHNSQKYMELYEYQVHIFRGEISCSTLFDSWTERVVVHSGEASL